MSVGHFGEISLFLPFEATLGTPCLHGPRDLAGKKERFFQQMTKGHLPYVVVFAPPT